MSITLTEFTFNDNELNWLEKVVIEKIHLLDNDLTKGCWASAKFLADFTGVKETSMRNLLSGLVRKGKITRLWFNGHQSGYRSNVHPIKVFEPSLNYDTTKTEPSQFDDEPSFFNDEPSQFNDGSGSQPSLENDTNRHNLVICEPSLNYDTTNKTNKDEILEISFKDKEKINQKENFSLVNESLAIQVEENLFWLRSRKNLKRLPEQEWISFFTELEAEGLFEKFQEFYVWVENLSWVNGTVSINLLRSQIEGYKNREHIALKNQIKQNGADNGNGNYQSKREQKRNEITEIERIRIEVAERRQRLLQESDFVGG